MDEATKAAILSAVRTILIAGGAILTAHGFGNADQVNEIVGALMVIIPAVWGVLDKIWAERKAKERETVAVQAGVAMPVAASSAPTIAPEQAQRIIKTYAATEEGKQL